jgi:hypothetical protein
MISKHGWFVFFCGVVLFVLSAYIALIEDLTRSIPTFLGVYAAAFIVYLLSIFLLSRNREPFRGVLAFVFAIAILCRIVNLNSEPTLSNDIYRYLWEGRVIEAGMNPFSHPPSAPELEFLQDENYESINHKHLETIYPPLAQGAFFCGVLLKPDLFGQKLIFTLFDMATMVVILMLLLATGRNPALCAVYGWSPLVVTEFSGSGHVDSLGIFLLMAAALLFQRRFRLFGFVSLALSFLAKYVSAVLLPFFITKKRNIGWMFIYVAVIIIGYFPFAGASGKLISSLKVYAENWEFNSLLFRAIGSFAANPVHIRYALGIIVIVFAFYEGYRRRDLLHYAYRVIACSILLMPTIYPWYLCWLVPLLCFFPSRAWLGYTGLVMISYWVWVPYRTSGVWDLGTTVLILEYLPFYGLLAYEGYQATKVRRKTL